MPELPEVEVSRMGIAPHLENQTITDLIVRQRQLRWIIPDEIEEAKGQVVLGVRRRAKYLLIDTAAGSIILHLGMSGKLRLVPQQTPIEKHDHLDIVLANGQCLRFNDPRRFGACLWQSREADIHKVLIGLGPEPLTSEFDGEYLLAASKNKTKSVKNFIMDNKTVVGVGNIYASESLFMARIDPRRPANKIAKKRYLVLADAIKQVLASAIDQGGTTLKDFTQVDGNPGYFAQKLYVYGRKNKPCLVCETPIKSLQIGQRNSFYCHQCQR